MESIHKYALHLSLRSFPNVAFETVPMFVWLTMTLSRPFNEDRLALRPSTPSSLLYAIDGCDVLGFVLAGSVSSSSTLQVFREASYLWGLLCPPVNLLGRFPSLRHVHGSSPTEVVEVECRPLIHSSVGLSIAPSFTFCSKLIEPVRMKTHTTTSIVAIECFRARKRINTTTSLNPRSVLLSGFRQLP